MRMSWHCARCRSAPSSGMLLLAPSSTRPASVTWLAPRAEISAGPPVKMRRVAPRTPISCAPLGSLISPRRYSPGPSISGTRAPAVWSSAACSMFVCAAPPPARTPRVVASTPSMESGAAATGVAKVTVGTAPVSAETAIRRRRLRFMTRFRGDSERDGSISGPAKACHHGTDRVNGGVVYAAVVPQWDGGDVGDEATASRRYLSPAARRLTLFDLTSFVSGCATGSG
jgi:hypothetical protein